MTSQQDDPRACAPQDIDMDQSAQLPSTQSSGAAQDTLMVDSTQNPPSQATASTPSLHTDASAQQPVAQTSASPQVMGVDNNMQNTHKPTTNPSPPTYMNFSQAQPSLEEREAEFSRAKQAFRAKEAQLLNFKGQLDHKEAELQKYHVDLDVFKSQLDNRKGGLSHELEKAKKYGTEQHSLVIQLEKSKKQAESNLERKKGDLNLAEIRAQTANEEMMRMREGRKASREELEKAIRMKLNKDFEQEKNKAAADCKANLQASIDTDLAKLAADIGINGSTFQDISSGLQQLGDQLVAQLGLGGGNLTFKDICSAVLQLRSQLGADLGLFASTFQSISSAIADLRGQLQSANQQINGQRITHQGEINQVAAELGIALGSTVQDVLDAVRKLKVQPQHQINHFVFGGSGIGNAQGNAAEPQTQNNDMVMDEGEESNAQGSNAQPLSIMKRFTGEDEDESADSGRGKRARTSQYTGDSKEHSILTVQVLGNQVNASQPVRTSSQSNNHNIATAPLNNQIPQPVGMSGQSSAHNIAATQSLNNQIPQSVGNSNQSKDHNVADDEWFGKPIHCQCEHAQKARDFDAELNKLKIVHLEDVDQVKKNLQDRIDIVAARLRCNNTMEDVTATIFHLRDLVEGELSENAELANDLGCPNTPQDIRAELGRLRTQLTTEIDSKNALQGVVDQVAAKINCQNNLHSISARLQYIQNDLESAVAIKKDRQEKIQKVADILHCESYDEIIFELGKVQTQLGEFEKQKTTHQSETDQLAATLNCQNNFADILFVAAQFRDSFQEAIDQLSEELGCGKTLKEVLDCIDQLKNTRGQASNIGVNNANGEISSLKSRIFTLDNQISTMQAEGQRLQQGNMSLQNQILTLQADGQRLQQENGEIASLKNQISTLDNQILTMQAEGQRLEQETISLQNRIADLQTQMQSMSSNEAVTNLQTQVASLQEQLQSTSSNEIVTDLQAQVANLQAKLDEAYEFGRHYEQYSWDAYHQIEALKAKNKALNDANYQAGKETILRLKARVQSLYKEKRDFEKANKALQNRIDELSLNSQKGQVAKDESLAKEMAAHQELKNNFDALQKQYDAEIEKVNKLEEKLGKFHACFTTTDNPLKKIHDLERENQYLERELGLDKDISACSKSDHRYIRSRRMVEDLKYQIEVLEYERKKDQLYINGMEPYQNHLVAQEDKSANIAYESQVKNTQLEAEVKNLKAEVNMLQEQVAGLNLASEKQVAACADHDYNFKCLGLACIGVAITAAGTGIYTHLKS